MSSEGTGTAVNMNPYVAVVGKKSRNLHKKLDKIEKADAQQKSGKVLNEEQLVLLATKNQVEKQMADVDYIKNLLEEVAMNEAGKEKETGTDTNEKALDEASQEIISLKAEVAQLKAQVEEGKTAQSSLEQVIADQEVQLSEKNTPPSPPPTPNMSSFQANLHQKIHKLLKLFHICARYPGDKLPADVNYFGKCLMGETSISGFKETLQESTRKTELYLDDELCSQFEASRGMTYLDISNLMDELAVELGGPPTPPPVPEPQSPVFNFFTDNGDLDDDSPLDTMDEDISKHVEAIIIEEKASLMAEGDQADKKKQDQKRGPRKNNRPKNSKDNAPKDNTSNGKPPSKKTSPNGSASEGNDGVNSSGNKNTSRSKGGRGPGGRGPGAKAAKGGKTQSSMN